MRGIVRPCRRQLGPELHARWLGHLCGLCLSLRDSAGQSARVLTGYDVLLVSILTEAQTGRLPTTTAGPCPLRGFRTAEVVDAATPAVQAGTAVALLVGSAGLADKVNDGDVPVWLGPVASRSARHLARVGAAKADDCSFDGTALSEAASRAETVEARPDARLEELLEPAASAVASMWAHTAVAAGVPANAAALSRAGRAFGGLVHLVDATEDRESDCRRGRFNPLEVTGTTDDDGARLARRWHADLLAALEEVDFVDGALAEALLGPTLRSAVERVWGGRGAAGPSLPARPHGGLAVGMAAALVGHAAMWNGGRRRGRRGRNDPFGGREYDPYARGGYGRRRGCGGPSCGQLLACDCCANCCCNECGGDDNCCCCI